MTWWCCCWSRTEKQGRRGMPSGSVASKLLREYERDLTTEVGFSHGIRHSMLTLEDSPTCCQKTRSVAYSIAECGFYGALSGGILGAIAMVSAGDSNNVAKKIQVVLEFVLDILGDPSVFAVAGVFAAAGLLVGLIVGLIVGVINECCCASSSQSSPSYLSG